MIKKYFSILSLSALALMLSLGLSGCIFQPADNESGETAAANDDAAGSGLAVQPAPVAQVEAAPVITDAEVEMELKEIDAELNTVKTTGFEPKDLTDKDLGL